MITPLLPGGFSAANAKTQQTHATVATSIVRSATSGANK